MDRMLGPSPASYTIAQKEATEKMARIRRVDITIGDHPGMITASQLGEMLGFGQWAGSSSYNVWLDYMGKPRPEPTPEQKARYEMGHRIEEFVANHLAEDYGVSRVEAPKKAFVNTDYPWFGCHPDRIVRVDGASVPVEIKASSVRNSSKWGEDETDEIPYEYLLQCFGYFASGVPNPGYMWLVRFCDNAQHRYIIQRPKDSLIRGIMGEARGIIARWDAGEMPSPATAAEAARIWTSPEGTAEADEALATKVGVLRHKQEKAKELDAEIDRLKAEIIDGMKGAEALIREGERLCTYKLQTRTSLDTKALKAEMPDVYGRFAKTTETRVFR